MLKLYMDANNFGGNCLSQNLSLSDYKISDTVTKEDVLETPDDLNIGDAVDVNLKNLDKKT